jgi:uncharacterized membrane protein YcaP (DUF421 family)
MALSHIVARAAFAYVFAVIMVRLSGHRSLKQADTPSFVLAVILGDMFDDLLWAEVSAGQFITAVSTLMVCHLSSTIAHTDAGARSWRRDSSGPAS